MMKSLRVLLAGKSIEEILFENDFSMESSFDAKKVSNMILENSTLLELGGDLNEESNFNPEYFNTSEHYKNIIEKKSEALIQELIEKNKILFNENLPKIKKITKFLIEYDKINKDELKRLIES